MPQLEAEHTLSLLIVTATPRPIRPSLCPRRAFQVPSFEQISTPRRRSRSYHYVVSSIPSSTYHVHLFNHQKVEVQSEGAHSETSRAEAGGACRTGLQACAHSRRCRCAGRPAAEPENRGQTQDRGREPEGDCCGYRWDKCAEWGNTPCFQWPVERHVSHRSCQPDGSDAEIQLQRATLGAISVPQGECRRCLPRAGSVLHSRRA